LIIDGLLLKVLVDKFNFPTGILEQVETDVIGIGLLQQKDIQCHLINDNGFVMVFDEYLYPCQGRLVILLPQGRTLLVKGVLMEQTGFLYTQQAILDDHRVGLRETRGLVGAHSLREGREAVLVGLDGEGRAEVGGVSQLVDLQW
jgi:hypothetical protein